MLVSRRVYIFLDAPNDLYIIEGQPPPKATNPKLLFQINSQIPPLF